MNRQISFARYRAIDLCILGAVLAVTQAATVLAAKLWFPDQLYSVSPVAAVVTLVLMRWGIWAGLHAVLGGIVFTLVSGGNGQHMVIYCVGNLFSLAALLMLRAFGKEKIRQSGFLSLMLALVAQALMLLGRAAVAAALDYEWQACLGFITTDILSVLFTLLVIWAARKADGLFEDQKHYLLRVAREREHERRDQF